MAQNITLMGASYQDVPAVTLPKTGGGTAEFFDARSITYNLSGGASVSANPSNAIAGQGFSVKLKAPAGYTLSNVSVTMGGVDITSQVFTPDEAGGGGPSATQHSIYFEFTDSTNTTITGYWDDSFISNSITATNPTTYGGKTVTLAQLDGVTWYEVGGGIPLNTELVDYTKVMTGYAIDNSGVIENTGQSWDAISDYIPIDPSMTFTFKTLRWYNVGFFNSSKNMVRVVTGSDIETSSSNDVSTGTLNASNIPSTAAYIILSGNAYNLQGTMSLIRTA